MSLTTGSCPPTATAATTTTTTPKPAPPASPPPTPDTTSSFPPVQPGGSLLVAYQVRYKPVLVVGGGPVAAGRILNLLNADAHVHVCCPPSGLSPEVAHRIRTRAVTHHPTVFTPQLLTQLAPAMVLTAVDDPVASTRIYELCHSLRIPVNVADVPPECDFYFGSVHRDGPLQIMVSTNGNGPKLANIVRRQIAQGLPENLGEAITKVGVLRKRLRKVAGGVEEGARRMEWMSRVCEEWTLEELCEMGEIEMEMLLEGYREGRVVTLREIRGPEETEAEEWVSADEEEEAVAEEEEEEEEEENAAEKVVFEEAFDGSFGWF